MKLMSCAQFRIALGLVVSLATAQFGMPLEAQQADAIEAQLHCDVRDIDRYGRFVGQCFLGDGRDIAAVMIEVGVATEYCRYSGGYYGTC